jgi:hypothetical protein
MHEVAPDAFNHRNPAIRKLHTVRHDGRIEVDGPGHKWAGDGHEKLAGLGFEIYGFVDYWGGVLDYALVPNARDEDVVDYCFLMTALKTGGEF